MNLDIKFFRTIEIRKFSLFRMNENKFNILLIRTPAQLHMLQQKQQQMQMQRDPSGGENQQRPQSPASTDNAPSPSKRPRLDGASFSSQVQMQNGRGQGGVLPQQVRDTSPNLPS